MQISIVETVIIVLEVALILGVLLAIAMAGFLLFRRIRMLESRVEKLEAEHDISADKTHA